LADGWLTVQRIITHLPLTHTQLVTVAACQSAQSATQRGDEQVGLIQALMTAGANSVVASLWNINDTATPALFESFYNHLMAGATPATALYHAQIDVQKRWPHPYFWASFAISGLAHQPITPPTSASDLTPHLDQLKKESQQRGGPPMNEERIIKDSRVILGQIGYDDHREQLEAAFAKEPTSGVIFASLLSDLTKKARKIENEADLLFVAHAIQTLVEETAPLHDLLMDEQDTEISQAQATRTIALSNHRPNQNDDERALEQKPILIQEMFECNKFFVLILPSPDELAAQDPTFRAKLADMGRKIGLLAEADEEEEPDVQEQPPKGLLAKLLKWLGLG